MASRARCGELHRTSHGSQGQLPTYPAPHEQPHRSTHGEQGQHQLAATDGQWAFPTPNETQYPGLLPPVLESGKQVTGSTKKRLRIENKRKRLKLQGAQDPVVVLGIPRGKIRHPNTKAERGCREKFCARKGSVRTTPRQTSGLNMRQKGARTRQDAHGRVRRCRRVSTRPTCLRHAAESYGTVKTIRGFIVEERQHIVWGGSKTIHRLFGSLIRPCLSRLNIGRDSRWSCLARHIDDPRGKDSGWSCLARHNDDPSRKTRGGMPCAPPRRSQKSKKNLDPRPS